MRPAVAVVAVVAASLAACAVEPSPAGRVEQPLIGGVVAGEDPGTVALLGAADGTGEAVFCSGTLVSPRVVLTAAHCVDGVGADPDVTVFFGDDVNRQGTRIGAVAAEVHPEWNGDVTDMHDIGMLLLQFAADPEWARPLHLSEITEADIDRPVRRVGFGKDDADAEQPDGAKREGAAAITFVAPDPRDWFLSGSESLITCTGDSGGPVFVRDPDTDEELLAAVHSFTLGETPCQSAEGGDARVDLYVEDFILPWIAENDLSCGADFLCARVGCAEDPDCEPCGPDGACVDGCDLPDIDCPTQALGEICQADSQCESALCVFWQDDPSTHFCSRECGDASDCPDGMSCETVAPFGRVCYYEDDPPGVIGSDCEQATDCGAYLCDDDVCVTRCDLSRGVTCPADFECESDGEAFYCRAQPSGGSCAAAPGGQGGALWLVLAVVASLARRGRRQGGGRGRGPGESSSRVAGKSS